MFERTLFIAPLHSIQTLFYVLLFLLGSQLFKNKVWAFLIATPLPIISHSLWNYNVIETIGNELNLALMIIISRSVIFAIRVEKKRFIEEEIKNLIEVEGKLESEIKRKITTEKFKNRGLFLTLQKSSTQFLYNKLFRKIFPNFNNEL
jgi:hypothetical protein